MPHPFIFCSAGSLFVQTLPCAGNILQSARGHRAVGKVGLPPGHRVRCKTRIGLVPSMNQPMPRIVGRQLQALVVQLGQQRGGSFNLRSMLDEQRSIVGVIEVSRQQRQRQSELCSLRPAHINHSFVVDKVGVVVIEDLPRHLKASPLQIRIERACKDILKAVVFRAVIIAVDRSILWIDSSRPHHLLLRERILRHIHPGLVRQRRGSYIVQLALPVESELKQPAIEGLRRGVLSPRRKGRVAIPILRFHNLSVLDLHRPMPRLNDELVSCHDIAEDDYLIVRRVRDRHHLANRGHPSAQQSL